MPEETTVRNRVDTFAVAAISILYSRGANRSRQRSFKFGSHRFGTGTITSYSMHLVVFRSCSENLHSKVENDAMT